MFGVRLVAGAAALCLTAAVAAPSQAGAQSAEGIGTSKASQTLIDLVLGDGSLLGVKVLADTAQSTIDSAVAQAHAVTNLVPLSLTSSAIPGLSGIVGNLQTFESRTPGGNPNVSGSALNLASPGGVLGLPLGLLGGSLIPTSLTSALDGAGARTGLDSALVNLSLVTGLLKVTSVSNKQGTAAALASASGNRALTVDNITLLSLADLLGGLDLDLAKLPLGIVSDLLSKLQVPLLLPSGATDLKSAVDGLTAGVTPLLGLAPGTLLSSLTDSLPLVNTLLGTGSLGSLTSLLPPNATSLVPIQSLLSGGVLDTVSGLLTTLQNTLSSLLNTALGALGNLSLLTLNGATIGASTKAADTLANSDANVTGKVGGMSVLGLPIPGLDLNLVADTLNTATGLLSNVLGTIDPSLRDLVKVSVLDKSTSVTAANGYNNAIAGIDILSLKITPPALLSKLIGTLTGNGALSSLGALTSAGLTPAALPVLGGLGGNILGLGNLLGGVTGVLTKGLTVKVGSVQSASQFRVASAPAPAAVAAPVESLPRTGADTRTLGLLAAGMAALALGVRRWARRPEAMMD